MADVSILQPHKQNSRDMAVASYLYNSITQSKDVVTVHHRSKLIKIMCVSYNVNFCVCAIM